MERNYTGRANHIEDYLVTVRTGQWFGWTDFHNKVYANLIVHDGGSKPSEAEVNAGLKNCKMISMLWSIHVKEEKNILQYKIN